MVLKISEAIESELLQDFEVKFIELMSNTTANMNQRTKLVEKLRETIKSLYYFHYGINVQKRYLFSVIEKRIPTNLTNRLTINQLSTWKRIANIIIRRNQDENEDENNNDDDDSSAGGKRFEPIFKFELFY